MSPSAQADTPQVPFQKISQNSGSHLSQLSAPLFTEDRYSTSTDNDQDNCDAEVSTITRWQSPSQATTIVMSPKRPVLTPSTADYSTQSDPNQVAPLENHEYSQNNSTTAIQDTNNYLIPDRSNRRIHDIQNKTLHISIPENRHGVYLVELPDLKSLLHTSRYLMDEITGQFYAVFGNSYQCMSTIPRLFHTWEPGQLIDELVATRCTFGYMGPTGPAPATQASQPHPADPVSTVYNEDIIPDLTTQKPPPRTVPYQPPSFNLDRPTRCLKEERIEVHNDYISAVSNFEHKKDLINRLKQSEPHNILTYEAEMACHMALHNDVLGRIHTILKQDDYSRTLEELSVINGLHAYDDIQLFSELYGTSAVIERITSKAGLIEKQLNRSGMYALPQTPFATYFQFYPKAQFNILTYHAGCTIICNRSNSSQTTSGITEQGNLPKQFTTMRTGNTHCSNRLQYNWMAAPPTRVPLQITYQHTHSFHPLM